MPIFNGSLKSNEIFGALYNMIISQTVFSDNFGGLDDGIVGKFRVDGTLYGDTKLYYSADVLKSYPWLQDTTPGGTPPEVLNVLALHRPEAPECQAITIDQFRQIALTVDNYLSKRAWGDEGAFSSFNSVIMGMIRDTKRIYDYTYVCTYLGTTETEVGKQIVEVPLSEITATGEEKNRLEAETIAQYMADLFVDLKRPSRLYNDFGNMRSFSPSGMTVIWNAKYINKIRKVDLPTIFHKDGLMDKFNEEVMPPEYFGHVATASDAEEGGAIAGNKVVAANTVRSMVEKDYIVGGNTVHVFPGDALAVNTTVGGSSAQFLYAETYIEDDDIICKVLKTKAVPFMSAFEVGTSFFNARNLSTNHYLTWGYNKLEYLKNYPFITVYAD